MKKRKIRANPPEPPFGLDMSPDEALERFLSVDPREVEANISRAKKKKPPGSKKAPSGGKKLKSQNLVSLRDARIRKRNYGR